MIPFKVKISRFKKETIHLPTSWGELTLEQFLKIQNVNDPALMFQILTGCNLNLNIESFLPYMDWVSIPITLEDFKDESIEFDVFNFSYGDRIRMEQIINKGDLLNHAADICAIYKNSKQYYLKSKLSIVLPFLLAVVDSFNKCIEKENKLLSRQPTFEEKSAGIDTFKELSHFNTIDMLAREYNYTHLQIEKLEYNYIFLILRRKQLIANFEIKHREALKQVQK